MTRGRRPLPLANSLPVDRAIGELKPRLAVSLWRPEDRKNLQRRGRIGSAANQARALVRRLDRERGSAV